ncbi:lysyl oxidase homolog 2 [Amyelois transitella]|uniref:lysyl oxidase homolog 2 n=1 Tax=Amyelois transitella TaxID=680683 RepID=UPI00298FCFF8|nr:lysyl oxidase homolog 2 [Amyelois transitella]
MDDVVCLGDETSISQCVFSGWGSSDCEISEAAGVNCTTEISNTTVIRKRESGNKHDLLNHDDVAFRLVGSNQQNSNRSVRSQSQGRVEIYYNKIWGSVCPDGWTLYEAMVVCRHLGLGFAEQALQTDSFGKSRIVLSNVHCQGNESNVFLCEHRYGDVQCPSDEGYVAAVVCTERMADLALNTQTLEITGHLQDVPLYLLQCAMEENCLSRTAYEVQESNPDWHFETRRLLRFTASSMNIGNDDFRPYLPKHLWQWHLCHMHYHSMEVFATFDVLDDKGRRVAEGHKASFCLEDNTCHPDVEKKYSCKNYGDQGISVNCSDIYLYNLDCQWVDVTDVLPGDYTFKVAVNPHARIPEQTYHNNAATCQLRLTESYARVYGCSLGRP